MKIVLTGGPGSGKTTLLARLAAATGAAAVSEAATAVYAARQCRWDQLDDAGRRAVQRAIYEHQLAAEEVADRPLLLDRGTIDGAAYWPGGADAYWPAMNTTHAAELARYDAVILLESAAAVGAYDGPASNAARFEDAQAALASGRVLQELWRPHARQWHVPAYESFGQKYAAVHMIVDMLLAGSGG